MKNLLIALSVLGMMNTSAIAQQKSSKYDVNYPVCSNKNGYTVCTKDQLKAQLKKQRVHQEVVAAKPAPVQEQVLYVRCRSVAEPDPSYLNDNKHHSIKVSYDNMTTADNMDNPYNALPSRQYDGPVKNEQRNINVNQTSIQLPPIDGNIAGR